MQLVQVCASRACACTNFANCERSNPWDLCNNHCNMFIMEVLSPSRTYRVLFRNNSGDLAYVLLEVRKYLLDMVTALFSKFELLEAQQALAPLAIEWQQQLGMDDLPYKVHASISFFNTGQQYVLNEIADSILPCVTSQLYDILPSTSANTYQPPAPLRYTCISLPSANPIPSLSFPSPFFVSVSTVHLTTPRETSKRSLRNLFKAFYSSVIKKPFRLQRQQWQPSLASPWRTSCPL